MKPPLHERIRSDFETRILSGELEPGQRLPIEQELMVAYDCSRMTVNKAFSALAQAGLIDRRKRAGTFVARPKVHSMVLDVPDLAEEVRGRGQAYAYRQLHRALRAPEPERAEEAMLAACGELVQVDGLHCADAVPFAFEYRLVSARAVPDFARADFAQDPPGTWLLQHVPWTEAENRISAVGASAGEAAHLLVEPGTPCLCVERSTWRGSERITYVRQVFLGEAYDLVARFGSAGPGEAA
ncbi:histidine utilization repressor [Novosphingobium sp. 1949]|uniref:Histidine utilization repressor n=1 Tax=Novosphingobium organovorum TaxID=2930092 RepID=A0ABT0BDF2_9SPHN|nr:histidine utilization repressor [Novosphingobium organovorum]MCJ2183008.1 histidine utilization repressor [Novosphingobium organovorum]